MTQYNKLVVVHDCALLCVCMFLNILSCGHQSTAGDQELRGSMHLIPDTTLRTLGVE